MFGTHARRSVIASSCAALLAASLAACSTSSGGGGASGDGLPSKIEITLISDNTGPQAFYGTQLQAGVKTAIDQVNKSGMLGSSTLELTVKDTTSVAATASTVMAQAIGDKPVVILGPSLSNEALTMAPKAQAAKIPFLVDTSPKGITDIGEYVYSMTTTHAAQVPTLAKYLAKSVKNVKIIYSNDNPTVVDANAAAKDAFPAAGLNLMDDIGTPLQATDFSAVATKAADGNPDAIGVFGGGPMMSSVPKALRAAGYEGQLFGNMGADGTIAAAGSAVDGFTYMAEWADGLPGQASTDFASQFSAKNPDLSAYYPAVDGYNEVMFVAKALVAAQSVKGADVVKAMQDIGNQGFDTIAGKSTFTGTGNRQLVNPSIVAVYKDGKVTAVTDES